MATAATCQLKAKAVGSFAVNLCGFCCADLIFWATSFYWFVANNLMTSIAADLLMTAFKGKLCLPVIKMLTVQCRDIKVTPLVIAVATAAIGDFSWADKAVITLFLIEIDINFFMAVQA